MTMVIAAVVTAIAYKVLGRKKTNNNAKKQRVAVIGGGIAGAGAAWSLRKAGKEVVLYEKKPKLGGNAKMYTWDVPGKDGQTHKVETGLAVLAWPDDFFHSYNALIEELGMKSTFHDLKYFVSKRDGQGEVTLVFVHGREGGFTPEPWLLEDLKKWDAMVAYVRSWGAFFDPCDHKSLYRVSMLNPFNLIPLRKLCGMWGISDDFWRLVFVPIHTSTFIEVPMDTIPAVMCELLDDLVPFNRTPAMRTWETHAQDVFVKMTQDWGKVCV